MSGKRYPREKQNKGGFYLALAVCLVAVGIAAWSTYDAVQGYLTPTEDANGTVSKITDQEKQNNEVVQGQELEPEPEQNKETPTPKVAEATPAPSMAEKDAKEDGEALKRASEAETAGEVQSTPQAETENTEPKDVRNPPVEEGKPVNAGTIYEISTVLMYPVASEEVIKSYSNGTPVYSKTMKDWRIHNGIDIKAESGESVRACGNGIVKEVLTDSVSGNTVIVEHGDYDFWYCGLGEKLLVKEGDKVSIGQDIGTVSAVPTEVSDGIHLHLEVKKDEVFVNPQDIIKSDSDTASVPAE